MLGISEAELHIQRGGFRACSAIECKLGFSF